MTKRRKQKQNSPPLTATIKGAAERAGLSGLKLSAATGIPYQTLQYRYRNPGTWKFCEWAAVLRHIELNESEEKEIRKEMMKL
jgi:hypothetical protein